MLFTRMRRKTVAFAAYDNGTQRQFRCTHRGCINSSKY